MPWLTTIKTGKIGVCWLQMNESGNKKMDPTGRIRRWNLAASLLQSSSLEIYQSQDRGNRDINNQWKKNMTVQPSRFFFTGGQHNNIFWPFLSGALIQAVHLCEVRQTYNRSPICVAVGPSDTGKSLMAKMPLTTFGLEEAIYISCTNALLETVMNTGIGFVSNDPDTTSANDLKAFRDAINQVCVCVHASFQVQVYFLFPTHIKQLRFWGIDTIGWGVQTIGRCMDMGRKWKGKRHLPGY